MHHRPSSFKPEFCCLTLYITLHFILSILFFHFFFEVFLVELPEVDQWMLWKRRRILWHFGEGLGPQQGAPWDVENGEPLSLRDFYSTFKSRSFVRMHHEPFNIRLRVLWLQDIAVLWETLPIHGSPLPQAPCVCFSIFTGNQNKCKMLLDFVCTFSGALLYRPFAESIACDRWYS